MDKFFSVFPEFSVSYEQSELETLNIRDPVKNVWISSRAKLSLFAKRD